MLPQADELPCMHHTRANWGVVIQPKRKIFDRVPRSWRDLQNCVAQVFSEIGCEVHPGIRVGLPRGTLEMDVFVCDTTTVP
jgi:hypothetical protein